MFSPRAARLLWGMLFAWAVSALVILGNIAREAGQTGLEDACTLLRILICCGFLGFAWNCWGSVRNRLRARRAIALLIAFAVPLHGFAAVSIEVRGPAHLHAGDPSGTGHWHGDVEHHHHAADPAIVEIDDGDDQRRAAAAAGNGKRVASVALDTLTATVLVFPSRPGPGAVRECDPARLSLYFPGMLERPPRPAGDC
jgi:hypothetical protein